MCPRLLQQQLAGSAESWGLTDVTHILVCELCVWAFQRWKWFGNWCPQECRVLKIVSHRCDKSEADTPALGIWYFLVSYCVVKSSRNEEV